MKKFRKAKIGVSILCMALVTMIYHTNCSQVRLELVRGGNPKTTPSHPTRFAAELLALSVCENTLNCDGSRNTSKVSECSTTMLGDAELASRFFPGAQPEKNLESFLLNPLRTINLSKVAKCEKVVRETECFSNEKSVQNNLLNWVSTNTSCQSWSLETGPPLISVPASAEFASLNEVDFNWLKLDQGSKKFLTLFLPGNGNLEVFDAAKVLLGENGLRASGKVEGALAIAETFDLNNELKLSAIRSFSPLDFDSMSFSNGGFQKIRRHSFPSNSWLGGTLRSSSNGLFAVGWNITQWSAFVLIGEQGQTLKFQEHSRPVNTMNFKELPNIAANASTLKVFWPNQAGQIFEHNGSSDSSASIPRASGFSNSKMIRTANGGTLLANLNLASRKLEILVYPELTESSFDILNLGPDTAFDMVLDSSGANLKVVLVDPRWSSLQTLKIDVRASPILTEYGERFIEAPASLVRLNLIENKVVAAILERSRGELKFLEVK